MASLLENHEEMSLEDILATKIEDTTLSQRAKNVLLKPEVYAKNAGIMNRRWYDGHPECTDLVETVGELVNKTYFEILWRRGCGRKTYFEIKDAVRNTGLKFRGED